MFYEEKREHRRFPVEQPVTLLEIEGQDPPSYLFMEDISGWDIRVLSSSKLKKGTRLKLRLGLGFPLKLMGAGQIQVVVWGTVVRSEDSGEAGILFEGVEMLGAGPEEGRG